MIKIRRIVSALAIAAIALGAAGCGTFGSKEPPAPMTAEARAYNSVLDSDAAVLAAIRIWAETYAIREARNESTKADDLPGYLGRRSELLKEEGRVRTLKDEYTKAVSAVVQIWLAAKELGLQVPDEPVPDSSVTAIANEILKYKTAHDHRD